MEERNDVVWAVVITAGGKYIGGIEKSQDHVISQWMNSKPIRLNPAYELAMVTVPMQDRKTGQMSLQRECRALPLGLNTEDHAIYCIPSDIWFIDDMKERDAIKYKNLALGASKMAETARAQESGIVVPTQGVPPGGFVGR